MRREDLEVVRTVMEMNIEERKGSGTPRKEWLDAIGCDIRNAGVCVDDVGDHVK